MNDCWRSWTGVSAPDWRNNKLRRTLMKLQWQVRDSSQVCQQVRQKLSQSVRGSDGLQQVWSCTVSAEERRACEKIDSQGKCCPPALTGPSLKSESNKSDNYGTFYKFRANRKKNTAWLIILVNTSSKMLNYEI